ISSSKALLCITSLRTPVRPAAAAPPPSAMGKEKADVSAKDMEKVKFAFDIFDFEGQGNVDTYFLGNLFRALNMNPSLKTINKFEPAERKGVKMMNLDDFLPMYAAVKKEVKGQGTYEEFVELLKLYDKNENGTMMYAELEYILKSLGEPLQKYEVDSILKECCPEEDEDGCIDFLPFLKKLCGKE
ncbi:unnamed protein product, partial [Meganyctiphanes norvegica]